MTKTEELLRRLHQRYNTVQDYADLCALVECGRAEGVEKVKAMILRESMPVVADFLHIPSVIVHVSVLAPTKEEP